MTSVNMDFCYVSIAILLFFHCCLGQDNPDGAANADSTDFEINIAPSYTSHAVNLGESLVLSCSVVTSSTEEPTLSWSFNGEPITTTDSNADVYIQPSGKFYMLRFMKIKDDDSGTYTCTGKLADQENSRSIKIEITKPIKINSEENQHGIVNQDGKVFCDVTATPTPAITWKVDGETIKNSEKYVLEQDGLVIKNLQFSDAKVYTCDIIVTQTGKNAKLTVNFVVAELPKIDMPPTIEPNNPKVGDEVKIHCSSSGRPDPVYNFQKDGNSIPDDQIDATNGILTIPDLKPEDEATYTCIASNVGGSVESSNTLDVKIPPVIKPIADLPDAPEKAEEVIQCVAEGDPAPEVTWKKDGMETVYTTTQAHPIINVINNSPPDADIKVVTAELKFDGVKADDAGSYVCSATNVVGSDTKTFKMGVTYAPHFDVPFTQDVFYGWTGHKANVSCQASGNPIPTFTWKRLILEGGQTEKWEDVPNSDPFSILSLIIDEENKRSTASLLVFVNDDETVYSKYMCEAQNLRDTASKTVELKQALPPSQPRFQPASPLSTMVTISIDKPDNNGGKEVQSYKWVYFIKGDRSTQEEGSIDIQGDVTTATIKGLKPDTEYEIEVKAVNEVGPSSESLSTFRTDKVSVPLKMSMTSSQTSNSATSYTVKWAELSNGGSPITQIIIKSKEIEVKNGDKEPEQWQAVKDVDPEFSDHVVPNTESRSYELKNLRRDSYYELRLIAFNAKGKSPEEYRIIKTAKGSDKSASASASLGSGIVIAIIVIIIFVLIAAIIIIALVIKRRRAARGGDADGGKAEAGKAAAEEEKLIQKEAKVQNETEKGGDGIEEKQEFEPDQKPDPQAPVDVADEKLKDDAGTEPTIHITPDTPDKPDNQPTA